MQVFDSNPWSNNDSGKENDFVEFDSSSNFDLDLITTFKRFESVIIGKVDDFSPPIQSFTSEMVNRRNFQDIPNWLVQETAEKLLIQARDGESNLPTTEEGLKFLRHILSEFSVNGPKLVMPDLYNSDNIKTIAGQFILQSGSPEKAMNTLLAIIS